MKIRRGSLTHYIFLVVFTILFMIILYPILDLIICKFFTHSRFIYTAKEYILKPILHGLCIGSGLFFVDISRMKK